MGGEASQPVVKCFETCFVFGHLFSWGQKHLTQDFGTSSQNGRMLFIFIRERQKSSSTPRLLCFLFMGCDWLLAGRKWKSNQTGSRPSWLSNHHVIDGNTCLNLNTLCYSLNREAILPWFHDYFIDLFSFIASCPTIQCCCHFWAAVDCYSGRKHRCPAIRTDETFLSPSAMHWLASCFHVR